MNCFFGRLQFPAGEWNVYVPGTSKHRRLGTNGSLLGGTPPKTPLERTEIFMEFLFFIIGFLLGSLGGVTAICLVQINRIGKEEGHGQAEHRD